MEHTSEKKCAKIWDLSRMPRGVVQDVLLNQRFIGNLLKKYRKNAKKSCFFYIQESLGGMDKIDTMHLVRNFARNLINVKFFSKKSILTSI